MRPVLGVSIYALPLTKIQPLGICGTIKQKLRR